MHDCQHIRPYISTWIASIEWEIHTYNINQFIGEFRMVLSKSRHQISVGKKKLEINRSSKVNSHVSLSFFQDPWVLIPVNLTDSALVFLSLSLYRSSPLFRSTALELWSKLTGRSVIVVDKWCPCVRFIALLYRQIHREDCLIKDCLLLPPETGGPEIIHTASVELTDRLGKRWLGVIKL